METVFKGFLTVIIAVIIAGSGLAVTAGFAAASASNDYIESVSKIIVESNYNETVIASCMKEAKDNDHELTVTVLGGTKPGSKRYARIELKYNFEIRLLGIKQEKERLKIV